MTLRQKALIVGLVTLIGSLGSMVLAVYVDQRFLWGIFLFLAGSALYSFFTFRCKHCGELMAKRKVKIGRMDFTYWGGIAMPKHCSRCGAKF